MCLTLFFFFFFNLTAPTEIYTLSLHDALPIYPSSWGVPATFFDFDRDGLIDLFVGNYLNYSLQADILCFSASGARDYRSEEHTSELQSRFDLVCRLLLEKKKKLIK